MPYFNLQKVLQALLKKGGYTLGVVIGLSKASDIVDLKILIKILQYYKINGIALELFKSYLNRKYKSNRKQYIISQDVSQNSLAIICGIPQGSILELFIFLIYVYDLGSNRLMKVIFVDEMNFFLSHKNIDKLFASIYVELDNISAWFKSQIVFEC